MYVYRIYLFFVYITTNENKSVLYTGMTNNLSFKLCEHFFDSGEKKSFTGKYNCYNCIYYEEFTDVNDAISREKEIKGWSRLKKEALINSKNPGWRFLNEEICGVWPPKEFRKRY